MKKKLSGILVFLATLYLCAAQKEQRAGVLAYAIDPNGTPQILLAAEKKGRRLFTWGEFSALQKADEIDFPRLTAARAFNDSTRCYFGLSTTKKIESSKNPEKPTINICKEGFDYILARLQGANLVQINPSYFVYLAKIDWVPSKDLNNAPTIYSNGKLLPGATKKDFIWIPLSILMVQMDTIKKDPKQSLKLPETHRNKYGLQIDKSIQNILNNQKIVSLLKSIQ